MLLLAGGHRRLAAISRADGRASTLIFAAGPIRWKGISTFGEGH